MPQSLDQRLEWLRTLSIIAVIVIHLVAPTVSGGEYGSLEWYVATILNGVSRWAVPVFIMISGALLLARPVNSWREYYKKVWWRIGVPLIAFSMLYLLWKGVHADGMTLASASEALLFGEPYYHLHFMFIIVGLQLLHPWLQRLSYLSPGALAVIAFGGLLTMVMVGLLDAYTGYGQHFFDRWLPYVGYYVAGYLIYRYEWYRYVRLRVAGSLFLTAAVLAIGTRTSSALSGEELTAHLLFTTFMPPVMVMSLMVFIVGLRMPLPRGKNIWLSIAGASYGIYLVHAWWIDVMRLIIPETYIWLNMAMLPVIVGVSLGMVLLVRRVPWGRTLIGEHKVDAQEPTQRPRRRYVFDS